MGCLFTGATLNDSWDTDMTSNFLSLVATLLGVMLNVFINSLLLLNNYKDRFKETVQPKCQNHFISAYKALKRLVM